MSEKTLPTIHVSYNDDFVAEARCDSCDWTDRGTVIAVAHRGRTHIVTDHKARPHR